MNSYEVAKLVRQTICNCAAECMNYNWSSEFITQEIKSIPGHIKAVNGYNSFNPNDLTKEQCLELGFGKWKLQDDKIMYLVPLWLYSFLPAKVQLTCIDGITKEYEVTTEVNDDNRGGYLAFGIIKE